jgi:CBS-domain-containing membrane protein
MKPNYSKSYCLLHRIHTIASVRYEVIRSSVFRNITPFSDRLLSAKLVPTFTDRECHVVSVTDPNGRILGFLDRSLYIFFQVAPQCTHEAEWTPFQTQYVTENLVAPGIEPGPVDL